MRIFFKLVVIKFVGTYILHLVLLDFMLLFDCFKISKKYLTYESAVKESKGHITHGGPVA